jgi:hypothetical protein
MFSQRSAEIPPKTSPWEASNHQLTTLHSYGSVFFVQQDLRTTKLCGLQGHEH